MRTPNKKRILSIALIISLVCSAVPFSRVWAEGDGIETASESIVAIEEVEEDISSDETEAPERIEESESTAETPASESENTEPEELADEEETSGDEVEPTEVPSESSAVEETQTEDSLPESDEVIPETVVEVNAEEDSFEEEPTAEETEGEATESDETVLFDSIADDSLLTAEELSAMDFSSKRLLLAGAEIIDPENVLSEYDGVYLLQYVDEYTALCAYSYYYGKAAFIEIDSVISIAEGIGDEGAVASDEMSDASNPLSELQEALDQNKKVYAGPVIALIDTGVNNNPAVIESVSVIGDSVSDDHGHGTAMADLIYSRNKDAKILSIKALGADGTGDASALYAAIEYAISRKVSIINLSLSAPKKAENAAVASAVQDALEAGIKVVAAAGNNGQNAAFFVPGSFDGVITIGAADETGLRRDDSNYGNCVEYNVIAESTSDAAAIYTGLLSAGKGKIDEETVFPVDYSLTNGLDLRAQVTILDKDFTLNREGEYYIPAANYVEVVQGVLHTIRSGERIKARIATKKDIPSVYRIEVYTNFVSPEEEDITGQCVIDYNTMTVTIPEQYSASDITVRWYQSENSYFYANFGLWNQYSDMDSRFRVAWHDIEDNVNWGFGPEALAEQIAAHTFDLGTYTGDDAYQAGDTWSVANWSVFAANDTCYRENGWQDIIDVNLYNKPELFTAMSFSPTLPSLLLIA